jgi:flagellar basal-body rod modification protein FlgD
VTILSAATVSANGQIRSEQGSRPGTLEYESFLKLLVAQLKQQDPMNPVDTTTYISQVAQLSAVEQSVAQTKSIERLVASSRFAEAGSLLGQRVVAADGQPAQMIVGTRVEADRTVALLLDGQEMALGPGVTLVRG